MEADGARIYIIDETAADDSRAERLIRLARLYAAEEAMPLPQTLCIAKGEYGKPYFENAPWLHFSVSHSGGLWVCALCRCDVGIDIEQHAGRDGHEHVVAGEARALGVGHDALRKAGAVKKDKPGACVVGADTIVWLDGEIIGKPRDPEDAVSILKKLSGKTHTVYTGVAVLTDQGCDVCHDTTEVTMEDIPEADIRAYVASGEPLDKAGAMRRCPVWVRRCASVPMRSTPWATLQPLRAKALPSVPPL